MYTILFILLHKIAKRSKYVHMPKKAKGIWTWAHFPRLELIFIYQLPSQALHTRCSMIVMWGRAQGMSKWAYGSLTKARKKCGKSSNRMQWLGKKASVLNFPMILFVCPSAFVKCVSLLRLFLAPLSIIRGDISCKVIQLFWDILDFAKVLWIMLNLTDLGTPI